MNNVHEDQPVVFQTRWALSYLRGPLTREQIQTLMAPRKQAKAVPARQLRPWHRTWRDEDRFALDTGTSRADLRLQPASRVFLGGQPSRGAARRARVLHPSPGPRTRGAAMLLYRPALLGVARLHYADKKAGIDSLGDAGLAPADRRGDAGRRLEGAEVHADHVPELDKIARAGREFRSPAAPLSRAKSLRRVDARP